MNANDRGIGDNTQVSFFETEMSRLKQDYGYLEATVAEQLAASRPITVINDQATKDVVTAMMKNMRETWKRIQGVHEAEKAPDLERGRAKDGYFFGLMEKLGRRDKKANKGEGERLNDLLTDYDTRILAAEQERRRREAEEAARIAREKAEAEARAAREAAERARIAEEARLRAERARTEETRAARAAEAAAAAQAAAEAEEALSKTRVDLTVTAGKAEETYIDTLATPADVMRQRSDQGVTSGMATEKFREITDRNILDLEKLRPYIPAAALDTALNKYAESHGYSSDESVQIKGARFGKRPKSRVY